MKKIFFLVVISLSVLPTIAQQPVNKFMTREEKLNSEYCSGLFNTPEGTYFDMLNDVQAIGATTHLNILDWLQGRVAGLQVFVTGTNIRIPFLRNSIAGIYIDETWYEPSSLNSLSVADIAMVKIIKGPFLGGINSPGGAIAIYTIGTEEE